VGLQDFASVFSRSFVVGFFVPALAALFAVDQLTSDEFTPAAYRDASTGAQLAVLGAAALVIGILLSGLNYPILRLFEGYPLRKGPLKKHAKKWREKWQQKYDELEKVRQEKTASQARTEAARRLNDMFPAKKESVLPTRFGNALRAFETHPRKRYGLDGIAAWPRIDMLLSDAERQTLEDAHGNVAFFINSCLAVTAIAVTLVVDALANTANLELLLRLVCPTAAGVALVWAFYNGAVGAVVRWGSAVRAAFDLHHFELLERLGMKIPKTQEEEEKVSDLVNRFILFAEPFPDEWRQPPDPKGAP
jgi:hypothetical protein